LFGRADGPFVDGWVRFQYAGYEVTVSHTGEFEVA
jgi:hypothetical protein